MKIIENILNSIDGFQQKYSVLGFPYAVIKKYNDDQAGHQAALLTYYGFLSLFPLLLVFTTFLQLVLKDNSRLSEHFVTSLTNSFPIVGTQLQQSVHSIHKTGAGLIIGLLFTIYGARGVADAFRNSANHIWRVPKDSRGSFPGTTLRSLAIIGIGGLGFFLASLSAGYATAAGHDYVLRVIFLSLSWVVLGWLFTFLIKISIPGLTPLRNIWVGAVVAAFGLLALQTSGGYVVTHKLRHLNSLYGTFAIVLGLLFWIYLQAQIVLYSLEIDTVRVGKLWPRKL